MPYPYPNPNPDPDPDPNPNPSPNPNQAHGAALEGAQGLLERSEAHGRSLDAAHVLGLAHVLGRPIVVLAPQDVEFRDALGNATG